MPPATTLSDADEALLKARHTEYRAMPTKDKEAFRIACAKYIARSRNLDDSNVYIVELFAGKVRNWFQNNNTEKRGTRLPLRIQQNFHPMRIFGHKNKVLIRSSLTEQTDGNNDHVPKDVDDEEEDEEQGHDGDEDDDEEEEDDNDNDNKKDEEDDADKGTVAQRAYIAQWNSMVRQLWDDLSEDEQRPYEHLAQLWSVQGPDDELKLWMAEKRSGPWFRSVASMFWVQCGMPVFIYGMFKDTNGKLRATMYDTTELWADTKPDTPLFRNIKGWDQDFRRKAWTFFQAVLDPEQASAETLTIVNGTRRQTTTCFVFEEYEDGTPILTDQENGHGTSTLRWQQIFCEYLRIHYCHEIRHVPWQSLHDNPQQFFAPGMIPNEFIFLDPSHINDGDLVRFYKNVFEMEDPAKHNLPGPPTRFRFSHYEMGPKNNRSYLPAIYNGTVTPAAPGRKKKAVQVPEFEGPPYSGENEAMSLQEPSPLVPGASQAAGPSRFASALANNFAKVQARLAAEGTTGAASVLTPTAAHSRVATTSDKGKGSTPEPWVEAAFDTSAPVDDEWAEENLLTVDGPSAPASVTGEPAGDLSFASDDEVEDVLDFLSSGPKGLSDAAPMDEDCERTSPLPSPSARAVPLESTVTPPVTADGHVAVPEVPRVFVSPPAPVMLDTDGAVRFAYLRSLSTAVQYQGLLTAMAAKLSSVVVIRAKSPVMWATWGHNSGHVPQSVQTSEKNMKTLMNWVKKGANLAGDAADAQRYCLVVGLLLSDIGFIEATTGLDIWPEGLPSYLAYSQLNDDHRMLITSICDERGRINADAEAPDPSAPQPSTSSPPSDTNSPVPAALATIPTGSKPSQKAVWKRRAAPPKATPLVEETVTGGRRTHSKARQV
ncbi:hypothetical protein GSI_13326 [Ganoderma sinense ZZ0214-1]|uniref:Uncharacterized protein n=1 Tax=Ganoderma sinense ZZ0214-1 TaxID=1077348 RepID=A0A2G8RV92_9APHY|nr:hypothetical protein GSI_13326 [Ganoderma sinense ZZ0214-1]